MDPPDEKKPPTIMPVAKEGLYKNRKTTDKILARTIKVGVWVTVISILSYAGPLISMPVRESKLFGMLWQSQRQHNWEALLKTSVSRKRSRTASRHKATMRAKATVTS